MARSPSPETHLRLLSGSDAVVLTLDGSRVVGFVTATTDGVLGVHIPYSRCCRATRGGALGGELVRRMLAALHDLYTVDLVCEPELVTFYASPGMRPASGMVVRRYTKQPGKNAGGAIY